MAHFPWLTFQQGNRSPSSLSAPDAVFLWAAQGLVSSTAGAISQSLGSSWLPLGSLDPSSGPAARATGPCEVFAEAVGLQSRLVTRGSPAFAGAL